MYVHMFATKLLGLIFIEEQIGGERGIHHSIYCIFLKEEKIFIHQ